MRTNQGRSSTTSIYMLGIADFDPKGTISEVRVHTGTTFGHTAWDSEIDRLTSFDASLINLDHKAKHLAQIMQILFIKV